MPGKTDMFWIELIKWFIDMLLKQEQTNEQLRRCINERKKNDDDQKTSRNN